jgi:hypothetical protein
MNIKTALLCAVTAALTGITAFIIMNHRENSLVLFVKNYRDMAYKIEREFIENIPVYRDYARPHMERELMKHSLKEQTAEVIKHGIKALKNFDDINAAVSRGELVSVNTGPDKYFYFHNVRKEYRYLTPEAKEALNLATQRFQEKLQARKEGFPVVKLAVSSAIRTVDHQEKVFGRKFVSIHSFGRCFDFFFDDYYVQLPVPETTGKAEEEIREALHSRTGFLMGDALRRQFKSILMETLLELQREGEIYVYYEEDNRCYHVTVREKN